jgi:hypothetical protein
MELEEVSEILTMNGILPRNRSDKRVLGDTSSPG